jgi:hypothetical protein
VFFCGNSFGLSRVRLIRKEPGLYQLLSPLESHAAFSSRQLAVYATWVSFVTAGLPSAAELKAEIPEFITYALEYYRPPCGRADVTSVRWRNVPCPDLNNRLLSLWGCILCYNASISSLWSWICARLCLLWSEEFIYTACSTAYVLLNARYQFKVHVKLAMWVGTLFWICRDAAKAKLISF